MLVLFVLILGGCGIETQSSNTNLTPTTQATESDKVIPTPTTKQISQTLLIADEGVGYYFEDLYTGSIEQWKPNNVVYKILGWGDNNCTLIAQLESSISLIDMDGNSLDTIFSFENLPASNDEGKNSFPTFSPNLKFFYYKVGYGEPIIPPDLSLSRFEKEDIELTQVENISSPIRISKMAEVGMPPGLPTAHLLLTAIMMLMGFYKFTHLHLTGKALSRYQVLITKSNLLILHGHQTARIL